MRKAPAASLGLALLLVVAQLPITAGALLPVELNNRPTTETRSFAVPKRLTLCKEFMSVRAEPEAPLVAIPLYRFRSEDAETIKVLVHSGYVVGTRSYGPGSSETLSAPTKPGEINALPALYDYKGGGRSFDFKMELFETAELPEHHWHPDPGYRVLWTKTFHLLFSEAQFSDLPATGFDFSRSKITDASLSVLRQHPLLQRLSVANNPITDAGLSYVDHLNQLRSLHLYNTLITDAGLEHLKHLPNLQDLMLSGTQITDRGLTHFSGLTHLESLDLANTGITDQGLENLEPLTNLKFLFLYKTAIGNSGLKYLRSLRKLETLFLSESNVSDEGLKDLTVLVNLKMLTLAHTKVTDTAITQLRKTLPDCTIEPR